MVRIVLGLAVVVGSLLVTGCGSEKTEIKSDPAAYNKCLEEEAAKVLDETGSNLDYANEVAAKACADLQ